MGRDRMRVLVCGLASIALIIASALAMEWYRLAFEQVPGDAVRLAIDLRNLHVCHARQACVLAPLTPLPGMFPTLAIVTLWSSLAVAVVVAFQAGFRVLIGSAYDAVTKLGYVVSLMAISIAVATAYMFGPEREGGLIGAAAQAGVLLQRTWGPVTLLAGLVAGFATLYMAVAPESSDLAAAYKPIGRVPGRGRAGTRTRTPSVRIPFPEHTGLFPFPGDGATGTAAGPHPAPERPVLARPALARPAERRAVGSTPIPFRPRPPTEPDEADLESSGERPTTDMRGRPTTDMRTPRTRTMAGIQPIRERTATGSQTIDIRPALPERTAVGSQPIGALPATNSDLEATIALPPSATRPAADPLPLRERAATGVYPIPAIALTDPTGSHSARERTGSGAIRELTGAGANRESTGAHAARDRTDAGAIRELTGAHAAREITGAHAARERTAPGAIREIIGSHAARKRTDSGPVREITGSHAARPASGPSGRPVTPAARPLSGQPAPRPRPVTGQAAPAHRPSTGQLAPIARPPTGPIAPPVVSRTKTGPLAGAPPHLRQKLSYVAITAELTAGGIDARREDGLARLVLWRDVVGVVARRLPPVYDGLVFVDVVSTAGSTLRIVPWTRLAGAPLAADASSRPRALIDHVAAHCPAARIDPATRHFLETGTAAQLPDLETLRAHDERLA